MSRRCIQCLKFSVRLERNTMPYKKFTGNLNWYRGPFGSSAANLSSSFFSVAAIDWRALDLRLQLLVEFKSGIELRDAGRLLLGRWSSSFSQSEKLSTRLVRLPSSSSFASAETFKILSQREQSTTRLVSARRLPSSARAPMSTRLSHPAKSSVRLLREVSFSRFVNTVISVRPSQPAKSSVRLLREVSFLKKVRALMSFRGLQRKQFSVRSVSFVNFSRHTM
mmetsp:Transcript_8185/g.14535  ORF Transcript_8185/g.14535 Transcript_8185/m.14535 type:complete len:223 (+) Transcript_8185:561-1229(+)